MDRVDRRIDFVGAHECHNCPGNGNPENGRACPDWQEWEETRTVGDNGEQEKRIVGECGRVAFHRWIIEMKASNHFATVNTVSAANRVEQQAGMVNERWEKMIAALVAVRDEMRRVSAPAAAKRPMIKRVLNAIGVSNG